MAEPPQVIKEENVDKNVVLVNFASICASLNVDSRALSAYLAILMETETHVDDKGQLVFTRSTVRPKAVVAELGKLSDLLDQGIITLLRPAVSGRDAQKIKVEVLG